MLRSRLVVIVVAVIAGALGATAYAVATRSPDIRDVSADTAFRGLIGTTVRTPRPLFLHQCKDGSYRFVPYVIGTEAKTSCAALLDIPAGSTARLMGVKRYASNARADSARLVVLSEYTSIGGRQFTIEYEWGSVSLRSEPSTLPEAFWQSPVDARVVYTPR